jgi:hypothetical protein
VTDPNSKDSLRVHEVGWRLLILVALVLMTFPHCVARMNTGLDGSWGTAINEASSRHMVYGQDVAFTYGPLGFVLVPRDVGFNFVHAAIFRLGLHVLWWTSVGALLFRIRGYTATGLFAAASVLSGVHFGPSWDVNFQLTGVIILTAVGFLALGHLDRRAIWAVPAVVVSAAALLAKFNIGVACTGSVASWAAIQLLRDRSPQMLGRLGLLVLAYVGTLGGLFRTYGGPVDALGEFLRYSREIAAGYSLQMSITGPASELAMLSAVLAAAFIALAAGIALGARYTPALGIVLFPLFMLFKSAIVRHDSGHVLTSCPVMIGLAGFLLPFYGGRWQSWTTQAVVALALVVGLWFAPTNPSRLLTRGAGALLNLFRYEAHVAHIRRIDSKVKDQLRLPSTMLARIGSATVDVYPWDICYATANGLNWRPRFALQSYAAYTPNLDRRSAQDYRCDNAPQYIIYSHQAIDAQHPCVVDPQTWLEIYRWYDVVEQAGELLLLERRVSPRWDGREELGSRLIALGERWEVPEGIRGPVILRAKLRLNRTGTLSSLFYKVYPPTIRVEYEDGSIAEHRLVWQNARSGFLASSLPRDIEGVRRLFEHGEADRVRAVSFLANGRCFEPRFRVAWSRIR